MTLAVDFLTLAILTQNKAVSKAKARNPKSPEREIQTGLNCGYDGFSEVILALLTLAGTYVKVHLHKMVYSILPLLFFQSMCKCTFLFLFMLMRHKFAIIGYFLKWLKAFFSSFETLVAFPFRALYFHFFLQLHSNTFTISYFKVPKYILSMDFNVPNSMSFVLAFELTLRTVGRY